MTEAKRQVDRMLEAGEKRGEKRGMEKGLEQGMEQGMEKGREQGMAQTVLHVLRARGITVTQALRQRIVSCPDVRQLTAWAKRAAVATSADDLFAST